MLRRSFGRLRLGQDDSSAYNHNAETYVEVGNSLGWAMAELLKKKE